MIRSKEEYLNNLQRQLKDSKENRELLKEFDLLISEMLYDLEVTKGLGEADAMKQIVEKIGSPKDVATMYEQEMAITPAKTQWTFIVVNIAFFVSGMFLTLFYHILPIEAVDQLWLFLTSIPTVLILLYMVFWALLGYEMGKEFGPGGKRLLHKTFYIMLVPNITLMILVVFKLIPLHWFDPLLTKTFIIVCILSTILLYPISNAGFKWGVIRSI